MKKAVATGSPAAPFEHGTIISEAQRQVQGAIDRLVESGGSDR